MRKTKAISCMLSVLFISFLLSVSLARASSSRRLINFQGYLTNQEGAVHEDGVYTLVFSLYETPTGGTPLWTERHETVSVIKGLVNVLLGSMTSFDVPGEGMPRVDFSSPNFLGITIDSDNNPVTSDPEMLPRQQIVPAIHAYEADYAKEAKVADYAKESNKLSGKIESPQFMKAGTSSTNSNGDATITFTSAFQSVPKIFVQATGVSSGVVLDVVNKNSTSFTVKARKVTGITSGNSSPNTNSVSAGTPSGTIENTDLGSHYHNMGRGQTSGLSPNITNCPCCSDYLGLSTCTGRTVQIWEGGGEKIVFGITSSKLGSHKHLFTGSKLGEHSHTVDSHDHPVDAPGMAVSFDWLAIDM